jgi:glycerol kinase
MSRYILALDQGTTSSRAIVFDHHGRAVAQAQQEFRQILPQPGIVEHDPEDIWQSQLATAQQALAKAELTAADIAAIGVTNQRETTIVWDRKTGKPIGNAIVWQSRVSAPICERLRAAGHESTFHDKTGLVVDPYFSGTKLTHLLESIDGLRGRAERGEVLFGTVDTFLLWRLSGGKLHVTDVSNASRTLLFNIHTLAWDDELLRLLNVPRAMLPEVRSTSEVYGQTDPQWFGGSIPLAAACGDQQAATFGQACFQPGMAKNTYGTGCFMLLNTGERPIPSKHRLLTTVGWRLNGRTTYCLEGAVFIAGAIVQWLRDGLGIIRTSNEVETLAASVEDNGGVVLVPALVGLGAPYWDPYARGTLVGLTRGTTAGHIARAALESMAYQTRDLLVAMQHDAGLELAELRVDGGASINPLLMQFQADILGRRVVRPQVAETTALGVAYLAGLAVGYWQDLSDVERNWQQAACYEPQMTIEQSGALYRRWQRAVERSLKWEEA